MLSCMLKIQSKTKKIYQHPLQGGNGIEIMFL